MILGRKRILELIERGVIRIEPFDPSQVGPASIDLTLGNVFRILSDGDPVDVRDDSFDPSRYGELIEVPDGSYISLEPGTFVLGITRERISLPPTIMGILSGRSRFARMGLMVHVSSSVVQPGSNNKQVLEIANLGCRTVRLYPGVRICQIVLLQVDGAEPLSDRYQGQKTP